MPKVSENTDKTYDLAWNELIFKSIKNLQKLLKSKILDDLILMI